MNTWTEYIPREWLWQTTWQAAVLACLILLVQRLLGRRLSAPWRYRLWLLLVVRLVMPSSPESALSVFNVVKFEPRLPAAMQPAKLADLAPLASSGGQRVEKVPLLFDAALAQRRAIAAATPGSARPGSSPSAKINHSVEARAASVTHSEGIYREAAKQAGLWVWAVGAALLLGRLGWSHFRFSRCLARYVPLSDPGIIQLFDACRSAVGVAAPVALIETEEVETPAVFGLFRKRLLLPDGIFERFSSVELRHIFLHELAHVRRRDLEMNWLTSLLQAVHWFNPVLWLAFSRMRADRELATDALALATDQEQDATHYGETLLKVLEGLNNRPVLPGVVGIAEDKARIKERLRAIAHYGNLRPWRWIAVAAVLLLGAVALTDAIKAKQAGAPAPVKRALATPAAKPRAARANVPVQPVEKQFAVRVSDFDTHAPLSGAIVRVSLDHYSSDSQTENLTTDEKGFASFKFDAADVNKLSYSAEKADYLVLRGDWFKQQIQLLEPLEISLARGNEIGGIVVDGASKPVAGAEIFFDRPMNMILSSDSRVYSQMWTVPAGKLLAATDSKGEWKARCVWPTIQWAPLRIRHKGFADATYSTEITKAMEAEGKGHALRFEDLLAKRVRLTLAPGLAVTGQVLDPAGKPLPGAKVHYSDRRSENAATDSVMGNGDVTTDAAGKFRVEDLPSRSIFFSVQTLEYAPAVAQLDLDVTHRDIQIRLQPGRELRGSVVSRDGSPVSGARISFEDWGVWQGVRWSTVTDESGRFIWDEAPSEKFRVLLEKEGFIPLHKTLQAEGAQRIEMNPVLELSGKILDAKTKEPVKEFQIFWADREEYLTFSRMENITGTNGEYALDLEKLYATSWEHNYYYQFIFRVEANGYAGANSRVFSSRDGDVGAVEYDIELKPADKLTGTVLDPAGQPVAGAQVMLWSPKSRVRLKGEPQLESLDKQMIPVTDASGNYAVSRDPEATQLIAVHPKGFARIGLKALDGKGTVQLQRWGRIEGVVRQYDQVLVNEEVSLHRRERSDFVPGSVELVLMKAKSDAVGRFTFDFVPPGEFTMYRWITKPRGGASSGSPEFVEVEEGALAKVQLGGMGRPVIGRFKVKNPYVPIEWQKDHHSIGTVMPKPPEGLKTREEFEAWRTRPEIEHAFERARHYPILFAEDGSFRIDEVVPGQYQFWMQIYDPSDPDAFAYSRYIAQFNGTFAVPQGPDENGAKPLDIGEFELTLNRKIEPGKTPAPPFTVSDLTGNEVKLADYQGKYVLLDFWATWCGPCVGEVPYLKEAWEKFKGNPKFAMISLSLDKALDEPRAFVKKNGMDWKQGFLGPWDKATLPGEYGVQGIPALFLIGPDGKILASGFEGHALASTLKKHVK